MRVMAQMAMVMNLDKCIGCHTCSVTCKQAWTNRSGTEYVWFNNVETRPGLGYPRTYEDQERWRGGWTLGRNGRLYRIYKIRTMYHNCEKHSGPRWSTPGDPRVTLVGRFLRRTHLDELPQLWNVLRG